MEAFGLGERSRRASRRTAGGFAGSRGFSIADDAFRTANAYFFARGFGPGEMRYTAADRAFTHRQGRRTAFLFYASTAAMRADPRFVTLCSELGLSRYRVQAGVAPDYRRRL